MGLGNAFMGPLGVAAASSMMQPPAPSAPPRPKRSKGEFIAGIVADAFAGAMGKPGMFAAQWGQEREREREDVQWQRNRTAGLEDYEAKQRIEQRYAKPDVSPMVRDADAYLGMTPDQKAAYQAMQGARQGDRFVTTSLPNGQFYAGPQSGLVAALTGAATPAPTAPKTAPKGRLTPITGGPALRAPATFRP